MPKKGFCNGKRCLVKGISNNLLILTPLDSNGPDILVPSDDLASVDFFDDFDDLASVDFFDPSDDDFFDPFDDLGTHLPIFAGRASGV